MGALNDPRSHPPIRLGVVAAETVDTPTSNSMVDREASPRTAGCIVVSWRLD
jgi:hypothetical protein